MPYEMSLPFGNATVSSINNLIPKKMTVQDAFGFNSQIEIDGFEPGHPYVPEKIKGFVWDKTLTRDIIEWLKEDNPDPIFLSGPTGCGKTSMGQNLFAAINMPAITITGTSSMEPDDIFTRMVLENGNTIIVKQMLLTAYEQGWGIIADEMDSWPPEVVLAMHRMWERQPITLIDGTIVKPAAKNLMIATANTRGDGQGNDVYVATNILNLASLNRFEKWHLDYPSHDIEVQILKNEFCANLTDDILNFMIKTAKDIRVAYQQGNCPGPISIRDLLRWGRKLIAAWNRKDVPPIYHSFDKAFGNGVDVYVRQMLHTLIHSHFGVAPPQISGV
jgi:cobaltochelatase CobS